MKPSTRDLEDLTGHEQFTVVPPPIPFYTPQDHLLLLLYYSFLFDMIFYLFSINFIDAFNIF